MSETKKPSAAKRESVSVSHVEFQAPMFVPGWGSSQTTLPSPNKTVKGLNMYTSDHGLVIEGSSGDVSNVKLLVPYANIKVMRFE